MQEGVVAFKRERKGGGRGDVGEGEMMMWWWGDGRGQRGGLNRRCNFRIFKISHNGSCNGFRKFFTV